jgi:hypothetical protein
MKLLTMAFLLCLTSSIANAQAFEVQKPIICDETQKIIKALAEKFNEKPVWVAKDIKDNSKYSLFVNPKTGAWTMLQMTPEVSCILGVGEESTLFAETV